MKFHPKLAPVKAAIFRSSTAMGMPEIAEKIEADLRPSMRRYFTMTAARVGRRYRRQGPKSAPPFLHHGRFANASGSTVTVRERDSDGAGARCDCGNCRNI